MSAKPTGLSAFTRTAPAAAQAETEQAASSGKKTRRRAQHETVALTVRISREDWKRLHHLAIAEGSSLQSLALDGLSKVFAEHGLPPITS